MIFPTTHSDQLSLLVEIEHVIIVFFLFVENLEKLTATRKRLISNGPKPGKHENP